MSDYPAELLHIDAEMVRLGRPPPPVVSYLQSIGKPMEPRDANAARAAWTKACIVWRTEVAEWVRDNPAQAERWHELDERYAEAEERFERAKRAASAHEEAFWRMARAGIPEECITAAREPFVTPALDVAREWNAGADWSLVLLGGFGAGKTSAAAWLCHEAFVATREVRWLRAPAACRHPLFGPEAEAWTARARRVGMLVLDDIGADEVTAHWRTWLEDIIDARWGSQLRTVITVNNLDLEGFKGRMGPRLLDRLKTGRIYDCGNVSLRGRR